MANAKTETVAINWHNEIQTVLIVPTAEAPDTFGPIEVGFMCGRTIPAEGKRSSWRIKASVDGAEFEPETNFLKAANTVVRAKFGGTKFHDVKGAIADLKLPEMADEEESAKENTDWTTFENAAELAEERDAASAAATEFFKGEAGMRKGLKSLGQHIANVANSLENNRAFNAWRDSGNADLQKALANKNAKSELIFVGKLPGDWFDMQPESSNSAKAYQRNFNISKNEIADNCAAAVWGKKQKSPKAGEAQKAFFAALEELTGDKEGEAVTATQSLARHFLTALTAASENGSILVIADGESGIEAAKDGNGQYIAQTQFGTGNRANELVLAFCKAMAANAPEAKAEAEAKKADAQAGQSVRPRVFAEYGVSEAALHLARILSSRDDWAEVLDALNGMADRAEKDTWAQVLVDVQSGVDAEKAEAEKAEAETGADDDA